MCPSGSSCACVSLDFRSWGVSKVRVWVAEATTSSFTLDLSKSAVSTIISTAHLAEIYECLQCDEYLA